MHTAKLNSWKIKLGEHLETHSTALISLHVRNLSILNLKNKIPGCFDYAISQFCKQKSVLPYLYSASLSTPTLLANIQNFFYRWKRVSQLGLSTSKSSSIILHRFSKGLSIQLWSTSNPCSYAILTKVSRSSGADQAALAKIWIIIPNPLSIQIARNFYSFEIFKVSLIRKMTAFGLWFLLTSIYKIESPIKSEMIFLLNSMALAKHWTIT